MKSTEELIRLIESLKPSTLLLMGEELNSPQVAETVQTADSLEKLKSITRQRLAIINGFPEEISADDGTQILAALRDLKAEIIYVLHRDADERWLEADFRALGFRHIKQYPKETPSKTLYYFDIYDYKLTPDWLNSKFWANPERWDIYEE